MRTFTCSRCGSLVSFEDATCLACGSTLGYLAGSPHLHAVDPDGPTWIDGTDRIRCANVDLGCNWLLRPSDASAQCASCRLAITRPQDDDPVGRPQLALAGYAMRRLVHQLRDHRLPVTSFDERDGGLGFRLLASASGQPVTIGHADGVVTIDVSEVDHGYRERLRVHLGEPYRTMLGHFRHEIGHYYWQALVAEGPWLQRCRAVFGDERASYSDAIERHYREGAPEGWRASYISEYATMHPWEDFAETWAHYLHITDALETVAGYGLRLDGVVGEAVDPAVASALSAEPPRPVNAYHELTMREILALWHPLAHLFNQVNRSMGKEDLYPFVLVGPVREKLAMVHEIVVASAAVPATEGPYSS